MDEKMPRRMMRFYRKGEQVPQEVKEQKSVESGAKLPTEEETEKEQEENISPTGRAILNSIPSMKYEDLEAAAKKKYSELKNAKVRSPAEHLTLREVERFKEKNNRLPNTAESEKIAENLYEQLKNVNTDELYGLKKTEKENKTSGEEKDKLDERSGKQERGRRRERDRKKGESLDETAPKQVEQNVGNITDIKALLSDENEGAAKNDESEEFDIGLGEETGKENKESEDIGSNADGEIKLEDSEQCPNCKKITEKIIYCPKCGTAFCELCSKSDSTNYACPKCGAKIKK